MTSAEGSVAWRRAFADYSQDGFDVSQSIDLKPSSGWAVHPRTGESHWAVFVPVVPLQPVGRDDKIRFSVRLAFQSNDYGQHGMGRFRLSATSDAAMIRSYDWIAAATPRAKLAAAHLTLGETRQARDYLIKAREANLEASVADSLVLALAHVRLGEIDQARKACGMAAESLKPAGAEAALLPLVRNVVVALGRNDAAAKALIAAANAGIPPAALTEAIKRNPNKADAYHEHANWYGARGRWKEAIADLGEAVRLAPNARMNMQLGILLIETGQVERYRELCRAMLERSSSIQSNADADQTLKTLHFLPGLKEDANRLSRLAEIALQGDKEGDWYEWFQFASALHEYRFGKFADALADCRASRARTSTTRGNPSVLASLDLVVESMALHGKGDLEGARRTLDQARSLLDGQVPGMDPGWWHDWLIANMLFREAEGLFAGAKTDN